MPDLPADTMRTTRIASRNANGGISIVFNVGFPCPAAIRAVNTMGAEADFVPEPFSQGALLVFVGAEAGAIFAVSTLDCIRLGEKRLTTGGILTDARNAGHD